MNGIIEFAVIDVFWLDTGEEIGNDCVEERDIFRCELGEIAIADRSKNQQTLIRIGMISFERAGCHNNRFDSTHTEIVMTLRGKLLACEFQRGSDFNREITRVHKSIRVQRDLRDHRVIRNHHCDWSEECFQVVREFTTTLIPGIHCDEHSTADIQWNIRSSRIIKMQFRN